eukprot:TRINITY_DN22935_c0_g1_i1.p2 TRINITY_DN22935_c0_g1~~TRINITY_DN22935_c0_g1_i1.p2  ORF type:complete len:103 (+),score=3.12 TRINITY_DN22935_c0_g1_i1:208-516(+)
MILCTKQKLQIQLPNQMHIITTKLTHECLMRLMQAVKELQILQRGKMCQNAAMQNQKDIYIQLSLLQKLNQYKHPSKININIKSKQFCTNILTICTNFISIF